MHPRARQVGLVVTELGDELLVYDLERHRAHCLNPTASRLWRLADGSRTARELAEALADTSMGASTGRPDPASATVGSTRAADLGATELGLTLLAKARLIEGWQTPAVGRPSRRAILRGLALAPAVITILAPAAAAAASCFGVGDACGRQADCCPGLRCRGVAGSNLKRCL